MTSSQLRYVALNSIMCKCRDDHFSAEVAEQLKSDLGADGYATLVSKVNRLGKMTGPELSELCKTFLNYLRAPDCAICVVSGTGRVLSVATVAQRVRAEDIPTAEVNSWAAGSITSVEYADCRMPEIRDAVLVLPKKYYAAGVDLVAEMDKAFDLYCWGTENPTKAQKEIVRLCESYANPPEDVEMGVNTVLDFVQKCEDAEYNPVWATQGPLLVSNLVVTSAFTKVPSWWSDFGHTLVSVMLPRGKKCKLAHARIPMLEFFSLLEGGKLPQLSVSGGKILVGDSAQ